MKHVWKRLMAVLLCLAMIVPAAAVSEEDAKVYGVCTADGVRVRKQPKTSASVWFYVDEGHVAEITGEVKDDDGNVTWYKVESPHPDPNGRTYTGYIHADYFRPLTEEDVPVTPSAEEPTDPPADEAEIMPVDEPAADVTPRPSTEGYVGGTSGYDGVEVTGAKARTKGDTNFRTAPSTSNGKIICEIPGKTELEILALPREGGKWYCVAYNGKVGYVNSGMIDVLDEGQPLLPDDSGDGTEVTDTWGEITADGVNFRIGAGTGYSIICELDEGTRVEVLTIPEQIGSKYWYCVRYDGETGYVQSNYVRVISGGSTEPDEEDEDAVKAIGEITKGGVNFRTGAGTSHSIIRELDKGAQVEVLTIPEKIGSGYWYRIRYDGKVGYVSSNYVRIVSDSSTEPDDEEETDVVVAIGEITNGGVNFRIGAGTGYSIIRELDEGTRVEVLTIPEQIGSGYWYRIRYDGKVGYVSSNYLRVISTGSSDPEDEEDIIVINATGEITASGVNFRQGPGQDYEKIGKLNAGTVVELLTIPSVVDSSHWYRVRYNGQVGYVQANFVRVLTIDESYLPDASTYGYAKLVVDTAKLRKSAGGNSVLRWTDKDMMLRIVGEAEIANSFRWYPVYYTANSTIYYVRADQVEVVYLEDGEVVTPPTQESPYGYVITTDAGVFLRIQPADEKIAQLPINTIVPCAGEPLSPDESGTRYTWYYVYYNGMYGYLRGDYVRVCTADGGEIAPDDQPEDPSELTDTKGKLLKNTNFRSKPSTSSDATILTVIKAGTVVEVLSIPESTKNGWYKIRYNGETGYVHASLLTVLTQEDEEDETSSYGYVMITGTGVYVRDAVEGDGLAKVGKGTVWPMTGKTVTKNGVNWYPIRANGYTGYVNGTYSFKLSAAQEESYLKGEGVPEEDAEPDSTLTAYVIVTHDYVNLRGSYSTESPRYYQVNKNTVMPCLGSKTVGTATWYNVAYEGRELWVHSGYSRLMTVAEYEEWLGGSSDEKPDEQPTGEGYVKTVEGYAPIRSTANGKTVLVRLDAGVVLRYYEENISAGGYKWFRVQSPDGRYGYIAANLVEKCAEDGGDVPVTPPDLGDYDSASPSQQETSYSTLKLGSSGDKVSNLVQELINQGYYTGSVTSSYTSAVQAAVKAFQTVNGLTADGIAGSQTQHKLFGTVEIGSGNTNDLSFEIYPVEKIDWYTGGIQELIPRGANFKVYDVKTGIVWWAHRWAGSRHADIETLTAADSARLCEIYGVDNLQEIVDKNLWQRRPCLITIGTRTFAASLDGMQHGTDTIANNGMDGQICLHFTNSEGHESQEVSASHKEAIEYAYNNCPAGQKK